MNDKCINIDEITKQLEEASMIEREKAHKDGFDWVYFEIINEKEFVIREHPDGTITREVNK